jgi:murein DD-endopeptidase MepM/ murein hydrolase activator NlpD
MAHVKYKFDPESLTYKVQDNSFKSRFVREYIGVIIAAILIASGILLLSAYIIVTPSTRKIKRENTQTSEAVNEISERLEQTEKVLKDLENRDQNIYKAVLESKPEDYKSDSISSVQTMLRMFAGNSSIEIAEYIDKQSDSLLGTFNKDKEAFKEFSKTLQLKEKMLVNIPSVQPVLNEDIKIVIYGFGKRIDPFFKTPKDHTGMDFSVPEGTRVFATADGIVSFSGEKRGDGLMIIINHGYGFATKYAHLNQSFVNEGKRLKRGDYIGTAGNSGKSMTPHLHYEVLLNNVPVNPVNFFFADLKPDQYEKIIRSSSRGGVSLD